MVRKAKANVFDIYIASLEFREKELLLKESLHKILKRFVITFLVSYYILNKVGELKKN